MSTPEFITAWKGLSPLQREAAAWQGSPLLVLAGPGAGKTRVLTCRIAHLLDNSQNENFRILALTFTNKAADEMRTRLKKFVPGLERRLFLGTFHSFCADVLRQHGTHLNIQPDFRIYAQEADLRAVLDEAVTQVAQTSDIISDLDRKTLPVIQRLKSRFIFPENCREAFEDPRFAERIALVYPAYEAELNKRNALDFNSLLLKTYQLFDKFPAFAKRYRTVYAYICVDEFQDTNYAQYALLRALTGDQYQNIFAVADDDQIIYQWNGASYQRIVDFQKDYEARVIQLPVVYRCPPQIVQLANRLIRHNFLRTPDKQPLRASNASPDTPYDVVRLLSAFPDFEAEAAGMATDIKQRHADHLSLVVVLGRSRRLLQGVEQALGNEGIPAVISQRKDEFESTPLMWLHAMLRLANNRQNDTYLETVCGTFFQLTEVKIEPEDVITQAQVSTYDYLRQWFKSILAREENLEKQTKEFLQQASRCLGEGRDFRQFSNLALDWFSVLVQALAGGDASTEVFTRYEEERLVWEELMREIMDTLGVDITLEAFLQELQMRSKESPPRSDAVTLMTIHGAKGKEFDHVYLIGLVDDELPSFQSKQKGPHSSEMEEERRNCFVAITRTRKTLTLSYAEKYSGWPKDPSRFLFEMGLLSYEPAEENYEIGQRERLYG